MNIDTDWLDIATQAETLARRVWAERAARRSYATTTEAQSDASFWTGFGITLAFTGNTDAARMAAAIDQREYEADRLAFELVESARVAA